MHKVVIAGCGVLIAGASFVAGRLVQEGISNKHHKETWKRMVIIAEECRRMAEVQGRYFGNRK